MIPSRFIPQFCVSLLLVCAFCTEAVAVPKAKPCKPYNKNICVERNSVPRKFRSNLPYEQNFLTPLQRYPMKSTLELPPDGNNGGQARPVVLIPAGVESITVCRMIGGRLDCAVLTAPKTCPGRFSFQDESGQAWTCDLDCAARRPNGDPDSNGNCDCDILYDTCTQGWN